MRQIPRDQVLRRLRSENPWWETHAIPPAFKEWRPRPYLQLFLPLVRETRVRRAVVLMGPRRVGKTVLLHHAIDELFAADLSPRLVAYFSVDHPLYTGLGLEDLLDGFREATGTDYETEPCWVFFDEIQYLKGWEVHLKNLVDHFPHVRAIASGSAAAALRLKSDESGAGRFTDFLLPPLTFYEYLDLLQKDHLLRDFDAFGDAEPARVESLNRELVQYLNFGGYPEVIFSEAIQADPGRFIKADIIDKVLLRDLPSLYGIQDIQELNSLFTSLAFNTAGEVSLEELAKSSGVAKNTIKRYVEYLEAAFLLRVVHRVDRSARRFQRARGFKVYLTNPSIRSALFAPVEPQEPAMGSVVETGIFAQWFHWQGRDLYYARWDRGEVDIVFASPGVGAHAAVEAKWSDTPARDPRKVSSLVTFCRANGLEDALVTTRTASATHEVQGVTLHFVPASVYCYWVGRAILDARFRAALKEHPGLVGGPGHWPRPSVE